jgi:hypothetical protein
MELMIMNEKELLKDAQDLNALPSQLLPFSYE